MSRLDKLVDNHNPFHWTENEMADWIDDLPNEKRQLFLSVLVKAKNRGMNVHQFACEARERIEAKHPKTKMSLIDFIASATEGWFIGGVISGRRGIKIE